MESQKLVQRRAYERVSASVGIRFASNSIFYTGTITNLSEKDMFIRTKLCFPLQSIFIVIVLDEKKLLQAFARVKRISKVNGYSNGMGVEIMNPSVNYLEFINSTKSIL